MYQFYVVEIQQYANGEYGHLVHYAYDEDQTKARLKGESKYHEVLAAAAVSELPSHAAIMFSTEGFPLMNQCYKHSIEQEQEPEQEEDQGEEPEEAEETPEEPETATAE